MLRRMLSRIAMVVALAVLPASLLACGAGQQKDKTLVCESRATTGTHISRPVCWKKKQVEEREEQDKRQMKRDSERIKRSGIHSQ